MLPLMMLQLMYSILLLRLGGPPWAEEGGMRGMQSAMAAYAQRL